MPDLGGYHRIVDDGLQFKVKLMLGIGKPHVMALSLKSWNWGN